MSLWKVISHVTKEEHWKKSMSLNNNFLQSITKYSITNFMANILADKTLYSDFSF